MEHLAPAQNLGRNSNRALSGEGGESPSSGGRPEKEDVRDGTALPCHGGRSPVSCQQPEESSRLRRPRPCTIPDAESAAEET